MNINCKISPDLENLDEYNKIYKWIPSSKNIRPSRDILKKKEIFFDNINSFYVSETDYLLESIFNYKTFINPEGKLTIKSSLNYSDNAFKFLKNKFPYEIDKSSNHYVMWYINDFKHLDEFIITKDIDNEIAKICDLKYQFVWYENPKHNITSIYHIQVFWTVLN